jgi:putative ATP-binding cassette transporter
MAQAQRSGWSRFVTITRPFFQSEARWRAFGLMALLVTLLLGLNGLNIVNSFVNKHFMTAVAERQASRFLWLGLLYAGVFAVSTAVAAFYRFAEETLRLRWREWLTRHMIGRYLGGRVFYRLNARRDIDNPDQRITEDVKTFTTNALSFLLIGVNSTLTLVAFCGVLWAITPWLFLGAVGYAVFGSLMTVVLGRKLVKYDVQQFKKEADLRYDLIQVRTNAESVALLDGEATESRRLSARLGKVIDNLRLIVTLNRNIAFFTEGYNYLIQLIPVLIVAPLYIQGRIEFGEITQAGIAFGHVMGAFSLIVREFPRISEFGAVIERLGRFWEAIDEETPPPLASGPGPAATDGPAADLLEPVLATTRMSTIEIEGDSDRLAFQPAVSA